MVRYFEADKGRFDSMLVRDDGERVAIAYTSGETVKLYADYRPSDRKAVEEFAEVYDLRIDWEYRKF